MTGQLYYAAAARFEAARYVRALGEGHRSANLHGHSFLARVRASLPENWATFRGAEAETLLERLLACVAPLDYTSLNRLLETPTDENIARWVRERLDAPGVETVGIQSTADQGADLDSNEQSHIWRRFRFEAAHRLPNVPEGHQCGRMHGHGFEVILHVNQELGGKDLGVDFDDLGKCWAPLHAQLHHACLNEIPGLENPTSEILASWIWKRLKPHLPHLSWVSTYETRTAGCHYNGANYRIWKEQRFESALRLVHAPAGDPRRRLHGHSYLVRLHLTAPLDAVMGWTVDYGDVKEIFKPTYKQLDHHDLTGLNALDNGDLGSLLRWIKARTASQLPQLDRIDLYQTSECGAVLHWGQETPALPGIS